MRLNLHGVPDCRFNPRTHSHHIRYEGTGQRVHTDPDGLTFFKELENRGYDLRTIRLQVDLVTGPIPKHGRAKR